MPIRILHGDALSIMRKLQSIIMLAAVRRGGDHVDRPGKAAPVELQLDSVLGLTPGLQLGPWPSGGFKACVVASDGSAACRREVFLPKSVVSRVPPPYVVLYILVRK